MTIPVAVGTRLRFVCSIYYRAPLLRGPARRGGTSGTDVTVPRTTSGSRMVARGAPDLERLQVWDSGDLWGSKARTVIIDKQRLQPTPSTAQHRADFLPRRQPPPASTPNHTDLSGDRLTDSFLEAFKHMCSANGTSGSDQNQTKVSTTTTTTRLRRRGLRQKRLRLRRPRRA